MRVLAVAPLLLATLASAANTMYTYKLACSGPIYKVKSAFAEAGLVPPTVPAVDDETYLAVKYNSTKVTLGNVLNQTETATAPAVYFAADPRKTYALVMVDPDVAPERGPAIRHWVVSDLKPSCTQSVALAGKEQSAYRGPSPRGIPQFHRYALYLFVQPDTAVFPPPDTNVTNFVIQDYVKQVGLEGPISGNFFRVEDYGQNE